MPNYDLDQFVPAAEKLVPGVTGIVTIDQLPEQKTLSKSDWTVVLRNTTKKTGKTSFTSIIELLKGDFYTKSEVLTLLRNSVEYDDTALVERVTEVENRVDGIRPVAYQWAPGAYKQDELVSVGDVVWKARVAIANSQATPAPLNTYWTQVTGAAITVEQDLSSFSTVNPPSVAAVNTLQITDFGLYGNTVKIANGFQQESFDLTGATVIQEVELRLSDLEGAGLDIYNVPTPVRSFVVQGAYNASSELDMTSIPSGSVAGQRFSYGYHYYEYMPGDAGTLVWIRTKK